MVARFICWLHSLVCHLHPATNVDVLEQAQVLAAAITPVERASESDAPLKPLRFKRPDYATAQSDWEWQHNRRAREIMDRARDGFL